MTCILTGACFSAKNAAKHCCKTAVCQSLTVTPMFLAVPSTIFIAASTVVAFRSGSFISAISCTCHMKAESYSLSASHKAACTAVRTGPQ